MMKEHPEKKDSFYDAEKMHYEVKSVGEEDFICNFHGRYFYFRTIILRERRCTARDEESECIFALHF